MTEGGTAGVVDVRDGAVEAVATTITQDEGKAFAAVRCRHLWGGRGAAPAREREQVV